MLIRYNEQYKLYKWWFNRTGTDPGGVTAKVTHCLRRWQEQVNNDSGVQQSETDRAAQHGSRSSDPYAKDVSVSVMKATHGYACVLIWSVLIWSGARPLFRRV